MTNIKRLAYSDIIWNYIGTIFNMGIQFMLLPFLLIYLNEDELGVWYIMISFSNFANLFSFGFTPAFSRNVAYCWNGAKKLTKTGKETDVSVSAETDYFLLKKILVTSQALYLFFAIIGTTCIGIFGTLHIWKVADSILNPQLKFSWLIFLIAIFINIYYGYFSSYLIGIGCVEENNKIIVVAAISRIIIMGILMHNGLGLLGASVAYLLYGTILRVLCRKVFYGKNELKEKLAQFNGVKIKFAELKECFLVVWYNAWRDGVVSIAEYLSTQMSTLVCSNFLSLSDTAMFSLTVQLVTAVGKISRSIHNAYTPVFQRSYITGEKETGRKAQAFCIFAFIVVYILGIFGLLIIGIPVLRIIKPEVAVNPWVIIGYGVYQFMLTYRNCYGAYLSCTNRLWYWKSYIITSFFTVASYTAVMFLHEANVWYIIFCSIIGEGIYNFRKWPGIVNKELNINFLYILRNGYSMARSIIFKGAKR